MAMIGKLPRTTSGSFNINSILGPQGVSGAGIYTSGVGGSGGAGGHTISIGGGVDTITLGGELPQPYINFSLIRAHGGTIVQCRQEDSHSWEYYVIPESTKNFDRELGKIISMHLLKG